MPRANELHATALAVEELTQQRERGVILARLWPCMACRDKDRPLHWHAAIVELQRLEHGALEEKLYCAPQVAIPTLKLGVERSSRLLEIIGTGESVRRHSAIRCIRPALIVASRGCGCQQRDGSIRGKVRRCVHSSMRPSSCPPRIVAQT